MIKKSSLNGIFATDKDNINSIIYLFIKYIKVYNTWKDCKLDLP